MIATLWFGLFVGFVAVASLGGPCGLDGDSVGTPVGPAELDFWPPRSTCLVEDKVGIVTTHIGPWSSDVQRWAALLVPVITVAVAVRFLRSPEVEPSVATG